MASVANSSALFIGKVVGIEVGSSTSFRGRAKRGARNPYPQESGLWIPDSTLRADPE
jgi:hypothetical protein